MSKWKWSNRLPEVRVLVDGLAARLDPPPPVVADVPVAPEPAPKSPLERLDEVEAKLVAAGFPPLSPYWRATFEAFYREPFRRQLVARVGRRGGKSSSLCRLLVLEALYGGHIVPPGDVGVCAVVSVDRTEAARRIATVASVLDAFGVRYETRAGALYLVDRAVVVQPFTASIAGVSGFTCIFALCDEVAKWRDSDTGANPAKEVLASLRPTMATQPKARIVLLSSPLGTMDAHARSFDEGDTSFQLTTFAPTWVAHPALTEEQTHALEPDEAIHRREYGARPIEGTVESIFAPTILDRITRADGADLPARRGWTYIAAIDPATRGNAWTLVVATVDEKGRRVVVLVREWRGSVSKPLRSDEVFEQIGGPLVDGVRQPGILTPYGVEHIWCDQWAFDPLADHARNAGLTLLQHSLSPAGKILMFDGIARDMGAEKVEIPKDPRVRADLLGVHRRVTPTGVTLYLVTTPDGRHADFAPSLGRALTQPCAAPRRVPETEAERHEADLLKADKARFGGAKKAWWERGGQPPRKRRFG